MPDGAHGEATVHGTVATVHDAVTDATTTVHDTAAMVSGTVAPGFEPVADALATSLAHNREQGAALAVYRGAELVVDLWGGEAAPGRAWERDTTCVVLSATKGLATLCVQLLVERGLLELDAPVEDYWPQFGAAGKGDVQVRHLLAHTAGVLTFPQYWEVIGRGGHRLADVDLVTEQLAAAPASWSAGTAFKYAPLAFGYLVGALVRRVDGRTLGRFFAEEIAAPLGLSAWIGLPAAEQPQVATLADDDARSPVARLDEVADTAAREHILAGRELHPDAAPYAGLFLHPDASTSRGYLTGLLNRPEFQTVELPAVNGVTTARSLARAYALLSGGGELDGVRLLDPSTVAAFRVPQPSAVGYGVGYQLVTIPTRPGERRSPASQTPFGHSGSGGSFGFADPEFGLAFGYVKNRMLRLPLPTYQLMRTVYRCL